MIDEKAIPLEAITAAEVELARVLKGFDYCMPADGMQRVLTAALSAISSGSTGETEGWQPIETFDGSEAYVLVFDGSYVSEARYQPSEKGWWLANMHPTDAYDGQVYPTHWRPLPSPPSAMLAAAGGRDE